MLKQIKRRYEQSFDKLIKDNPPQDVAPDKEDNKQSNKTFLIISPAVSKNLLRGPMFGGMPNEIKASILRSGAFSSRIKFFPRFAAVHRKLTAADGIPMTAYLLRPLVLRIRALSQVDHQETVLVEEETDQVEEEGEITLVHLAMAPGVRRTIDFTVAGSGVSGRFRRFADS